MREIEAGLKAHLAKDANTVCFCWRVVLKNGTILGFTEHDRDLNFAATSFLAASGFAAASFEAEEGLSANTNEVVGGFSNDVISEEELAAGQYDGARVEVYLVNWHSPSQHQLLYVHEIGEVTREAGGFKAELRSITHKLLQPQGNSYSRRCNAVLGDEKCRFDTNNSGFYAIGTVASVESETRINLLLAGDFAKGFFSYGVASFESGLLIGQKADVETNSVIGSHTRVDLWLPLESEPAVGDEVRLITGCDKSFYTCQNKFNNHLNFRGFPHMPGADFAYSYVDGDSEHDGNVLYK